MNNDQLEGKWKQVRGKFKQKYGNVTDDDTTFAEGKFDEMLGGCKNERARTKKN